MSSDTKKEVIYCTIRWNKAKPIGCYLEQGSVRLMNILNDEKVKPADYGEVDISFHPTRWYAASALFEIMKKVIEEGMVKPWQ